MQLNFNPAKIKLIIGLGNPDKHYEDTYHNAGFLFIDYLKTHNLQPKLKTNCYMNESGGFVKKALQKQGIKPEELFLIHDDSDLNLGKYKIAFGRGAAGHKGVESVIKALKTKDFWRLRIGIRPIGPTGPIGLIRRIGRRKKAGDFVLKKISPRNRETLEKLFEEIISLLPKSSR
jgi:PTH1 family peptidyl-tRNA hydrolase